MEKITNTDSEGGEIMRTFDYSFLETGLLPAKLMTIAYELASLKTITESYKTTAPKIFTQLEKIAKIQSVKTSNAIEGIITTDKRIEDIVNQNSAPLNHKEIEISGYRDALNTIHLGYSNINFTEDDIKALHKIMLSQTGYKYGGEYKTTNNLIIERDSEGNRQVRFRPTSAKETPAAMEQLILAYIDARDNSEINKLLLIPCVILDFLCIHPFSDGNGRLSRLLSLLLLYKSGYDIVKYISFEEQINNYKAYYYDALKQSSQNWESGENNYTPFIEQFVFTLYKCYEELNKRFDVVNHSHITKKARVEAEILNSLLPLSKSDLHSRLPDISFATIEAVLRDLVKQGKIKKIGKSKLTKYIKI